MNRKEQRIKVWLKYNKHCAYCGKEIEYKDMQVDHIEPLAYAPYPHDKKSAVYSFENLMPSCRRCNHYKRAMRLEEYRTLIETLHERIKTWYILKVAIDYGIITIEPFDGTFYFEKEEEILRRKRRGHGI